MNVEKTMLNNPSSELQLARRVAAGDEHALNEFFTTYGDALFAFISHRLDGNKEDSEDLWQECLLAALHGIGAYRGDSRLFTWLCAIATHKVASYYRRKGRPGEAMLEAFSEDLAELIDHQLLPEEWVQQRVTRTRVVLALQELPQDYRSALVARYVDDWRVERIAARLGKTYKATESLLARARVAFQEKFLAMQGERKDGR